MRVLGALRQRLQNILDRDKFDWLKQHPVPEITRVINYKRYNSMEAKVVACGRGGYSFVPAYLWLMHTQAGSFFIVVRIMQTKQILLEPSDSHNARHIYESLTFQDVPYEQIFDEGRVTDA